MRSKQDVIAESKGACVCVHHAWEGRLVGCTVWVLSQCVAQSSRPRWGRFIVSSDPHLHCPHTCTVTYIGKITPACCLLHQELRRDVLRMMESWVVVGIERDCL